MERGSWYRYDFSKDSSYLIVGFGSIRMFTDVKNKGYEWDNLLKYKFPELSFNVLFVGDANNSWWHTKYKGLSGYGPYVLADFLNSKITECGASKTLYVGVSMGGYGAILLGCLTHADQIMAFSPQTWLSPERRKLQLNSKFAGYDIDENLTDLKQVLKEKNNKKSIYKIWYGSKNTIDVAAANRISNIDNVFLYPIDTSRHNSAPVLIKSGEFKKELYDFFGH